uniref:Pyrimidine nucleoside phosphorylase C-terminal domain-containing protein n=1 Tax=Strigamia maritima TaxID=126957 RepID=T1IT47_STRMM
MKILMSASSSRGGGGHHSHTPSSSTLGSSSKERSKSPAPSSRSTSPPSPPIGFASLTPQLSKQKLGSGNRRTSIETTISNISRKASSVSKVGIERRELPISKRGGAKHSIQDTPRTAVSPTSRLILPTSKHTVTYANTIPDIIKKKRNGERLFPDEIMLFVKSIVEQSIQQAQIGAMLMAIYLRGMNTDETVAMTRALIHTGSILSWPEEWRRLVVDKHSTGGIGDKTSLILAPILAVPMIASTAMELSGTMLEKLQSIPGIRVNLTPLEMRSVLHTVGCCITSEYSELLPADQVIYKNRELTSTVDSPPLIIASVMSKKAAEGLAALVLDIKYGRGSFMKSKEEARNLAYAMVNMGYKMGIKTSALLSSMDSPVGNTIGNALEVAEALQCLKGHDKADLKELATKLGGELLYLLSATTRKEGADIINKIMREGTALQKFKDMIVAQGVRSDIANRLCDPRTDVWSVLPRAPHVTALSSQASGYVHYIDALELGRVAHKLGAGRSKPKDPVYSNVGLELQVHVGSSILKGVLYNSVIEAGCLTMICVVGQVWVRVHHIHNELGENFISHIQKALIVRPTEIIVSHARVTEII